MYDQVIKVLEKFSQPSFLPFRSQAHKARSKSRGKAPSGSSSVHTSPCLPSCSHRWQSYGTAWGDWVATLRWSCEVTAWQLWGDCVRWPHGNSVTAWGECVGTLRQWLQGWPHGNLWLCEMTAWELWGHRLRWLRGDSVVTVWGGSDVVLAGPLLQHIIQPSPAALAKQWTKWARKRHRLL